MCDVKLVKLREIDVKKYVFKRALKEAAIKNTTQNLEDCRMDKIQELNNVLMLKKFWSVEFGVVLIESEEDDSSGLRANAQKFSSCQMRKKIFNQEISILTMFKKGRMFWSMLSVADL